MREISTRNKPSCPPHEAMAALGKFHFSDSQRDILRSCYYERGIRSVSKDNEAILQAIAEEIKATPEQVKHWINAEKARQKRKDTIPSDMHVFQEPSPSQESTVLVKVQKPHKRSGFNLFTSEHARTFNGDGRDVLAELSKQWSSLTAEEKASWNSRAKDGLHYSEQQKKKVIKELISIIEENLKTLSKLGVEGYGVVVHTGTSDCKVFRSSDVVENYLSTEEERGQAVDRRFYQFMCGATYVQKCKKRKLSTFDEILEYVRADWKKKYQSTCGHGRIPYSNPIKLKCVAVGLPAGISFKQPALYNSSELRQIYNNLDSIHFLPVSPPTENPIQDSNS